MQAFDAILAGPVAEYMKISKEVGGDVQTHVRTRVSSSALEVLPVLRAGRAKLAVRVCIPLALYPRIFGIPEDAKQTPR